MQGRGLTEAFGISESKLAAFLQRIESGYEDNPYHNRCAWSAQAVRLLCNTICKEGCKEAYSSLAAN